MLRGYPIKRIPACRRVAGTVDLHVGTRMRDRREQLGMSQDALARAAGLNSRQLSAYEAGEIRPKPAELCAIATALDVPISFFFGGGLFRR